MLASPFLDQKFERPTYPDSCRAFYAAAEKVGARIYEESSWGKLRGLWRAGKGEDELLTVAAYLGPENPEKVIIVTSGLHGSELYMGAMLQIEYLLSWAAMAPKEIGLLCIHGLNPWGSSHSHRNDQKNRDPNRANVTLAKGEAVPTLPEYHELHPFINPRSPDTFRYAKCLEAVCEYWFKQGIQELLRGSWREVVRREGWRKAMQIGLLKLKKVIGSGQGAFREGVFWAGDGTPTQTSTVLRRLIHKAIPQSARTWMLLDAHSGLGLPKEFSLISHFAKGSVANALMGSWYGENRIEVTDADQGVAVHSSGVIETIFEEEAVYFPCVTFTGLCVEIGTKALVPSSWAVCKRNSVGVYHYSDPYAPLAVESRKEMDETFFPASRELRQAVIEKGHSLLLETVRGLTFKCA